MWDAPFPPCRGFLLNVWVRTKRFSAVLPVLGIYFSTVYDASWHLPQAWSGTFFSFPFPACGAWQVMHESLPLL